MFAFQLTTSHPFPTLWSAKDETAGLVELLPNNEDMHFYLGSFQRRVRSCSFPHVPEECTEAEIRRFLENVEHHAAVHPNMLALLFATLAQGLQDGVYDRNGEKWIAGSVEAESQKGDVYSRCWKRTKIPRRSADHRSCCCHASVTPGRVPQSAHAPDNSDVGHDGFVSDKLWQISGRFCHVWRDRSTGTKHRLYVSVSSSLVQTDMMLNVFSAPRSKRIKSPSVSPGDHHPQKSVVVDVTHGSALLHGAGPASGNFQHR